MLYVSECWVYIVIMEFIVLTEDELTFGSSGGDKSDNRHFVYDFERWCK